ncbi:MAG: hypothetical protein V4760_10105 [Bdellovibrionota bacterium]
MLRLAVYLTFPILCVFAQHASAGSFRGGCKAILMMAGGGDPDHAFAENVSLMKQRLIERGCRASDIHLVVDTNLTEDTRLAAGPGKVNETMNRLGNPPSANYPPNRAGVQQAFDRVYRDLKPDDRVFVLISGHASGEENAHFRDFHYYAKDLDRDLRRLGSKYPGNETLKQVVVDICWSGSWVAPVSRDRTCVVTSQNSEDYSWYVPKGGRSFTYSLQEAMTSSSNLLQAATKADEDDNPRNFSQSSANPASYNSEGMMRTLENARASLRNGCAPYCGSRPDCQANHITHVACRVSCEIDIASFRSIERRIGNLSARDAVLSRQIRAARDRMFSLSGKNITWEDYERMSAEADAVRTRLSDLESEFGTWINNTKTGQSLSANQQRVQAGRACLTERF